MGYGPFSDVILGQNCMRDFIVNYTVGSRLMLTWLCIVYYPLCDWHYSDGVGFIMQQCTLEDHNGVCGDSFEKKAKLIESKLAPTILNKQAVHAAKSHCAT